MRTIRPPECKQATKLLVAVRCRPLTPAERARRKEILRIVDEKVVVVSDAERTKGISDRAHIRNRDKSYAFDFALGPEFSNKDVYNRMAASIIRGVVQGLNATIFAYGATGSGKTYTMAGTSDDPGLMVLSLQDIFRLVSKEEMEHDFEVTCSYLEVYNEVIYDLLEKSSGHLELREDPDQGIILPGLKRIQVNSADKILELLHVGNNRRKTEKTDANPTSSRSHAVLEIIVKKYSRNHLGSQILQGKVALVDLAGSERASEANSAGQKLRDGASINKSLLALANCINALGKQQKKGFAYVPYRNSKLTRILKDGLSGNSRTVMVATVSSGDDQYHHTVNTLKYADRAKEIKTHAQKNIGTIDSHIADYQRMISNLQVEVRCLRKELAEKEFQLNGLSTGKMQDDELLWLDILSRDIKDNVEERINLQKALFELEDKNLHNHSKLQQLDDLIARHQLDENTNIVEELAERRKLILDNIRDNDEVGAHYRKDIEQNEAKRKGLQDLIDKAVCSNGNTTYLRILSQYRLLGMTNTELQFQIAVRDQIIDNQREILSNLWAMLKDSGLQQQQIIELASRQGIAIEGWGMPSPVTCQTHREGTPLLRELPKLSSCGTSKTLGLSSLTPLTSRSHKCTNNSTCTPSSKNFGIQIASKCEHQSFYSGGMKNNEVASSLFHITNARFYLPNWPHLGPASSQDVTFGGIPSKLHMPLQDQELPPKTVCKSCSEMKKNAGKYPLCSEAASPETSSDLQVSSCIRENRQTVHSDGLQCCCVNNGSICETQTNFANFNEMRKMECCENICNQGDSCAFQKLLVEADGMLRKHTQQSNTRGLITHCCGYGNSCCASGKP